MMIEWRRGLEAIDDDIVEQAATRWHELTEALWTLSPTGKDKLRRLIKRYGVVIEPAGQPGREPS